MAPRRRRKKVIPTTAEKKWADVILNGKTDKKMRRNPVWVWSRWLFSVGAEWKQTSGAAQGTFTLMTYFTAESTRSVFVRLWDVTGAFLEVGNFFSDWKMMIDVDCIALKEFNHKELKSDSNIYYNNILDFIDWKEKKFVLKWKIRNLEYRNWPLRAPKNWFQRIFVTYNSWN